MILIKYLIGGIGRSTLLVLGALVGLFSFIDMMYEMNALGGLAQAFGYIVIRLPVQIYQLLPISMMLGSLFALSALVRDSEYPVIRMAGVSLGQLAMMLVKVGLLFGVITFLVGEFAVPFSDQLTKKYRIEKTADMTTTAIANNLWLKDDDTFIRVGSFGVDQHVDQLKLIELSKTGQIKAINDAETAAYNGDGSWTLKNIRQIKLTNGHVETTHVNSAVWKSRLDPDLLKVLISAPEKMSSMQLYRFVEHLTANHQDSRRYEVALWSKLGYPFTCLALILLSLPFAQYQKRSGNAANRMIAGILLGLLFFVTNKLIGNMAILYGFAPIITALAPTAVLMGLAVLVLWWQEYGKVRLAS
ncbi:LPS export ABC transporter permease LptG [Leeia sp. TBRC 13508]|uniref:LPS export ABC transporter permease LptG n=1 Tax=Leeia speluncae TaxID=2884804 RepID=A0ABS8D7K2_9NEIS|nr:LPS export ABC transporter permease LptG [Leeia speluncae]MCB6184018.1 LPS export ABC transporter permease LptG [Leeia speluncae]